MIRWAMVPVTPELIDNPDAIAEAEALAIADLGEPQCTVEWVHIGRDGEFHEGRKPGARLYWCRAHTSA